MPKYLKRIRKQNGVIALLAIMVYLGNVLCSSFYLPSRPQQEKKFAGSASCAACHNEIYKSHIHTAHYFDSRPASGETIKGSFARDKNKFVYNKNMEVVMEAKKNRFFQVSYVNGLEFVREPFDIVIGSGRRGQTYLYWNDNKLFQLPVSYYAPLNSWCNSPGFPPAFPQFGRPTVATCLECHTTYAKSIEGGSNVFDKSQLIFGIDCEKCHGPADDHVTYHQQHPDEKGGKYIINTKAMDRQIRLDACALCHSGSRKARQPAFSFMPGDKLDDFSTPRYDLDSVATLDVHGNQYGLLTSSQCFKMTQMDCSSCHNVHANEFNNTILFSQRCMNCHSEQKHNTCSLKAPGGFVLVDNCIDCHMPILASAAIQLNVANTDKLVPDPVRTHRVAIYREKTNEFINAWKTGGK
jgi:hypothetical protein